ncbi:hypothetical protein D3C73_1284400 [compost metagenome]
MIKEHVIPRTQPAITVDACRLLRQLVIAGEHHFASDVQLSNSTRRDFTELLITDRDVHAVEWFTEGVRLLLSCYLKITDVTGLR